MSRPAGPKVIVIGAGITGLAAAHYLQAADRDGARPVVTLLEAGAAVGGKLRTVHKHGCIIETGPDSFGAGDAEMLALVRAAGLQDDLVAPRTTRTFVFHRGRLRPYPAGSVFGIPTRVLPLLWTPLVSPMGKLRMAWDLIRARATIGDDESVGAFLQRRLGREVVERMVAPLLGGIHADRLDHLSLRATAPYFLQLRGDGRSLIRGLRQHRREAHRALCGGTPRPAAGLVSLRSGMQSLAESLATTLPAATLRLQATVRRVEACAGRYRVWTADADPLDADAVVLAVPGSEAARLLDAGPEFRGLSEGDAPGSVATVTLAFPRAALRRVPHGSGVVVPADAGCVITACTWCHAKWPHVAPADRALLRCYVGRFGADPIVAAPDEAIVAAVRRDLARVLGVQVPPESCHVGRWIRAMPRYGVGHGPHVAAVRKAVAARFPGVALAGSTFAGVGLGSCARQGRVAAAEILGYLEAVPASTPAACVV